MAFLIGGANTLSAAGYDVANSCRFNRADSAYMHKTPGGAGDQQKFTFSFWIKKCGVETLQTIFDTEADDDNQFKIVMNANGTLTIESKVSDHNDSLVTTQLFRDPNAWMHICAAYDTTQGTAANRVKLYVNGTQVTAFGTENYPAEDLNTLATAANKFWVGASAQTSNFCDMYIAEFCLIDGQQLTPTSFGEFNSNSPTIWQPIDVSGLTFGTNGFYLDFEASANLGNDANGGTDLTEVNLAATDQATDSPTNNFATMNPLLIGSNIPTFKEGNLEIEDTNQDAYQGSYGTIQVPTSGLWYWEIKNASGVDIGGSTEEGAIGGVYDSRMQNLADPSRITYTTTELSDWISGGAANLDDGEIAGILVDRDNATLKIYIEDSLYATKTSVTAEPIFPLCIVFGNGGTCKLQVNFGNPVHSISSANQDPNGYGSFEFATKSGYALCSKNLAEQG